MPSDLIDAFTRCDAIPVANYWVDDTGAGVGLHVRYARSHVDSSVKGAERLLDLAAASSEVPKLRTVNDPDQSPCPRDWPEQDVSPFASVEAPCLLMTTSPTSPATVRLAAPTDNESTDPGAQVSSR